MRNCKWLLAVVISTLHLCSCAFAFGMTKRRQLELRNQVKDAFYHAYNGYMKYAFPFDELNPIACVGRGRDRANPKNTSVNDVLGDFLLTLVDTLDTLAVIGDRAEFALAVQNTVDYLKNFDVDSHVQVFEVTIRMLGGLLSAHIIATDEQDTFGVRLDTMPNGTYNGELLYLARDLGYRLLPAFEASPSGAPYPRTNLKHGFITSETSETCVAGIGTLLLEFGTLSRLTNETIFEHVARQALQELWVSRTKSNLFGNEYDIATRRWVGSIAGIGAGIDSFYEYLFKGYVYFGNEEYLRMFETTYSAVLQHMRDAMAGYMFFNVDMHSTEIATNWVDSLSAFFPGLMVLAGDIDGAESAYMLYYHIWRRFRVMPERFNVYLRETDIAFYPLRPEFIESTYFLYRATGDSFYLDVGEMILADINALSKTSCGYATIDNITTGKLDGRMESFALSETLKYLYLLFDEDNPLHKTHNNYVFTTEGHVLLPLSPIRNGSAQYPPHSSFSKRKLLHTEHPPKAVKPFFYKTKNIRKRLRSTHPEDMFALPVYNNKTKLSSAGLSRKCPLPHAISIRAYDSGSNYNSNGRDDTASLSKQFAAELKSSHLKSPLEQLHATRQLTHAIHGLSLNASLELKHNLIELYLNSMPSTMPLRADFYTVGLLVDNDSQQTREASSLAGLELRHGAGTTTINASLAVALEHEGMCSPAMHLHLSHRQNIWKSHLLMQSYPYIDVLGIQSPPSNAETWLTPFTQQYSFMDYLFSRATKAQVYAWNIPQQPRARHGVPLLKNVWDEHLDSSADATPGGQKHPVPRRGILLDHGQDKSEDPRRRIVVTNGAGQVMTDYVIVRTTTDISLKSLARLLQKHNKGTEGLKKKGWWKSALLAMSVSTSNVDSRDWDNIFSVGMHNNSTGKGDSSGSAGSSREEINDYDVQQYAMLPMLPQYMYRRREYTGRLASFAEMSLYRGRTPYLVPYPTTLVMLNIHGPSSRFGCRKYTLQERKLIRRKVVAVRAGGGCSMWEKAIHAMNAGASALLADTSDSQYSHNQKKQKQKQKQKQKHNATQEQRQEENGQTANDGKSKTRHVSNACTTSAYLEDMCWLSNYDSEHNNASVSAKQHNSGHENGSGQDEIEGLTQQLGMPVVIVSQSTIDELEKYLASGLHVSVELL
ncbi:hypothetical protein GGI25_000750 [Coemansia spiralis]|uniref:alpha-1,2-Mannosidase n=1 Tax=Coemansia spiralis TaxID=417178 RepID=A0A9W8KZ75_9FUNG|nr:hypothetical protein GGI25_000750 [Coemansia spiralis]